VCAMELEQWAGRGLCLGARLLIGNEARGPDVGVAIRVLLVVKASECECECTRLLARVLLGVEGNRK
jgi:hypothetical protein